MHARDVVLGAAGKAGRFTTYWVVALLVMGLGFYAPVAEYISNIQDTNLDVLRWITSQFPYWFSKPALTKLRGFVQSEAFVATEITFMVVTVAALLGRFCRFCWDRL